MYCAILDYLSIFMLRSSFKTKATRLGGENQPCRWLGRCTPHFSFGLAKRETGRARSKEKKRLDALRHIRASALYGGRREMVPAGLGWLSDGRGVVRCTFDSGFPRRGRGGQRGARTHLTGSSFTVSRCGAPSISVTSVPLVPPSDRKSVV